MSIGNDVEYRLTRKQPLSLPETVWAVSDSSWYRSSSSAKLESYSMIFSCLLNDRLDHLETLLLFPLSLEPKGCYYDIEQMLYRGLEQLSTFLDNI